MHSLICPLDGGKVVEAGDVRRCATCQTEFPSVRIGSKSVYDYRCLGIHTVVSMNFTIPQATMELDHVLQYGKATEADFPCMTREEIRKKFGTKLQKEILYYLDATLKEVGPDARILDLGCGKGGTKRYLESLGFKNVVAVDYYSDGAEFLVDAHRMPFADASFDLIITTAIIDAFYNPFLAFREMSRVLKPGGALIATGSFWEEWHGSCFHCTPAGLKQLCDLAGLDFRDIWSSWGFIPAVASHALRLDRFKKHTYRLQRWFDAWVMRRHGKEALRKHIFRTSGGFGLYARKK